MTVVLTICSANYLAHAKALGSSVREHNPAFRFVIGLVDRLPNELATGYLTDFEVIPVEALDLPEFSAMRQKYNIVELNTAVKPFYMDFLYQRTPAVDAVIYLDPDMIVYGSFSIFLSKLKRNNIIVTPHSCTYDDTSANIHYEKVMLYAGIYNLGIIGTSRSPVTDAFLKWWKIRLYEHCYFSPGVAGAFFDQLWIVLAPIYFPGVYVETNPGYNFSYWNHFERRITVQSGRYVVNDNHDLILVHFSSYKPETPEASTSRLTEPTPSFTERPDLRALYDDYGRRLLACNYLKIKKIPWHFAPQKEPVGKGRGKRMIKQIITGSIHITPERVKKRLKRFAQFIALHC